jgi:hypothetical protein
MRLLMLMPLVIAAGSYMGARAQDSGGENAPRVDVYCSQTELGNSVVEVQWPLAAQGGANLGALVQQQVLDVTVYKDGFERGLYKTVKPGTGEPQFRLFKPQEAQEIPGLQNLRVTQFATSQEQPKEGLRLLMRPMPGRESADAKLEGLEPGIRYFVRLSSPDATPRTVAFTAAICPVDRVQPKGQ